MGYGAIRKPFSFQSLRPEKLGLIFFMAPLIYLQAMFSSPLIVSDAVLLGILLFIIAGVQFTASLQNPFWSRFYRVVPTILLMYFVPSVLGTFGIVDPQQSNLYYIASRFLLPAALVLLTLSIDLQAILNLGPKALIMFFAGTFGVLIGGPIALLISGWLVPDLLLATGEEATWRGMSTVAGSWIGGGANQTAMFEVFKPSSDLFSAMLSVDIIVANIWMGVLLYGVGLAPKIDAFFKADSSAIAQLQERVTKVQAKITRVTSTNDLIFLTAIAFGVTGISHLVAAWIAPFIGNHFPGLARYSLTSSFFWIVVISTSLGIGLSFTRVKNLEGAGASKLGSLFIYFLVATIGLQMNILALRDAPLFFLIGVIWILIHILVLFIVAKWIRAPFFFVAIGSQANIGGAASAPVVAAAFHSSLAPVGVLLAVLGYGLGTYAAYLCALLMQWIST